MQITCIYHVHEPRQATSQGRISALTYIQPPVTCATLKADSRQKNISARQAICNADEQQCGAISWARFSTITRYIHSAKSQATQADIWLLTPDMSGEPRPPWSASYWKNRPCSCWLQRMVVGQFYERSPLEHISALKPGQHHPPRRVPDFSSG